MKQSLGSIVVCLLLLLPLARAGHFDAESIQKELELREVRIRDLQAKFEQANAEFGLEAARTATGLRKTTTVNLGGMIETRYFYHSGKVESSLTPIRSGTIITGYQRDNRRSLRAEYAGGDFKLAEARLRARIEAGKHFDAFLQVDLLSSEARRKYVCGTAHQYWVRWKNIRDTGLGILVGRNYLVFSDRDFEGISSGYQGASFYMSSIGGDILGLNKVPGALAPAAGTTTRGKGCSPVGPPSSPITQVGITSVPPRSIPIGKALAEGCAWNCRSSSRWTGYREAAGESSRTYPTG